MGCCCSKPKTKTKSKENRVAEKNPATNDQAKLQTTPPSEDNTSHMSDTRSKYSLQVKPAEEKRPVYYVVLWDYDAGSGSELTVKSGDRLRELNEVGGGAGKEWLFATIMGEERCGTGYVPRSFVAMEGSLEAERWFFGNIPRREAENYLRHATVGTFLVQARTEQIPKKPIFAHAKAEYTLLVKREDGIKHYHVCHLSPNFGDGYFLTKQKRFCSVIDLVDWYKRRNTGEANSRLIEPPRKATPKRIELSLEAQKNWREIPREQIDIGKEVGRGNFGVVYEGKWRSGALEYRVAIKVLKKGSMRAKQQFLQEAVVMKDLTSPRLVKLFGVICSTEPYWLITEFVKDGSLRDYLRGRQQRSQLLSERILIEICAQVADGMRYCEEKGVVHRDLAARNVLVEERGGTPEAPTVDTKIADFGLAKMLLEEQEALQAQRKHREIPVKWTAPEALKNAIYSTASDVWSFAILCHEVFTHGGEPYAVLHGTDVRNFVVEKRLFLSRHPDVPVRVYDLMTKCFNYYPSERPKFKEIYTFFDQYYKETDDSGGSLSSAPSGSLQASSRDKKRKEAKSKPKPKTAVKKLPKLPGKQKK